MGLSSWRITSIVQLVTVIGQKRSVVWCTQKWLREMTKQPNLKDLPGKSTQRRIISHTHCFLTVCKKLSHTSWNSEKLREIERSVTSSYHGSKFLELYYRSWQRRSFAIVLFLSAIRRRKVIHVNFFVFSAILAGLGRFLLRSRKVATMAAWSNDFSSLLANVLKTFLVAERQVSAVLTY